MTAWMVLRPKSGLATTYPDLCNNAGQAADWLMTTRLVEYALGDTKRPISVAEWELHSHVQL